MKKTLSIFIDESGDFGKYDPRSPFYIVTLVFHDQNNSINNELLFIEKQLSDIGFVKHCIHSAPIIRGEEDYKSIDMNTRKSLFRKMMTFIKKININYKTICIKKKYIENYKEIEKELSKQLSIFLIKHISYFMSFDKTIIYYDNGQTQLHNILISVFNNILNGIEFRKVLPANYRLFQVADYICTIKMLELKCSLNIISKSERFFIEKNNVLKKQYIKPLSKKEFM